MSELNERVVKVETIVERHEELLKGQIAKNESLAIMATLLQKQEERDEKQNEQMERITTTLQGMNDNLSNLNSTQHQMQKDISEIGSRVEIVEHEQKERKKNSTLDLSGLPKKTIIWFLGLVSTVIIGAVTLYAYIALGLKQ